MTIETTKQSYFRFKWPSMNPILIKELRSRMRGPRAFMILTGFLLLLSAVALFFYFTMAETQRFNSASISWSAMIGVSMFMGIAFFELFLVAFITPALTAGTISGEREALTFEMLIATPLRPASILVGKMLATLSYVFLLIFAAVPMFSLVYIFGGVTWDDMLIALLVLVVTTITFGAIGMFWSTMLGKTSRATVMSYLSVITLIIGPLIATILWGILKQQTPPPAFSYLNPFNAMLSVISIGIDNGFALFDNPMYFFFALLGGNIMFGTSSLPLSHPAWHWTLSFYTLITLFLSILTVFFVRPAGHRRPSVPQALLTLVLILVVLGSMSLIFSPNDWQEIWMSPDDPRFFSQQTRELLLM
ncbi:MAG: ABC transporter permease [Ardenticatenaceae bacterium]